MKKFFLLSLPKFLILCSCVFVVPAHAAQTWNSFCSIINTDAFSQTATQLQASNYTVQPSDNHDVVLNSQKLTVNQTNKDLSSDQLQRLTNITSTALLTLILKYPMPNCSKHYYVDSVTPILDQMKHNEQLTFTWKNVKLKKSKTTYIANLIQLKIQKNNNIKINVIFSGLHESSNKSKPNILFPTEGQFNLVTSVKNYPFILAATNGNNEADFYDLTLPITVENLQVSNKYTRITATGNATLDRELNLRSAKGAITISNMDTLIANSDTANIGRLKTALILTKFAGRSAGNNVLKWDIDWHGNLFKVNNVPIPIW